MPMTLLGVSHPNPTYILWRKRAVVLSTFRVEILSGFWLEAYPDILIQFVVPPAISLRGTFSTYSTNNFYFASAICLKVAGCGAHQEHQLRLLRFSIKAAKPRTFNRIPQSCYAYYLLDFDKSLKTRFGDIYIGGKKRINLANSSRPFVSKMSIEQFNRSKRVWNQYPMVKRVKLLFKSSLPESARPYILDLDKYPKTWFWAY